MTPKELASLCHAVCQAVDNTATFIRNELGKVRESQIETKSLNSLVSYVDKTAEIQLVSNLRTMLPEATFLTEEETVAQEQGEWQWIIDPLDGTTNFLHQLPYFAVSVGLRQHDTLMLGVVYEVNRQECFYAWRNGGAWLNGKRIQASTTEKLGDSLIATGFPYRHFDLIPPYFDAMRAFMAKTRGLRRLGAAAVDLAYVACGRFEAFFEYGLSPWDVAAGILLVEEAGGRVSDFSGNSKALFSGEMVAACAGVYDDGMKVIKDAFGRNG
jgi:myo-inositol-1(or 4)-monophosphatase